MDRNQLIAAYRQHLDNLENLTKPVSEALGRISLLKESDDPRIAFGAKIKTIRWRTLPKLFGFEIKEVRRILGGLEHDVSQGEDTASSLERDEEILANRYIPYYRGVKEELHLLRLAIAAMQTSPEDFLAQLSDEDKIHIENGVAHLLQTTMFRREYDAESSQEGEGDAAVLQDSFSYRTDLYTPAAEALERHDYRTMAIYAACSEESLWDTARNRYHELHREEREHDRQERERRQKERKAKERKALVDKAKATPFPDADPLFDVAGAVHDMRWLGGHPEEPVAYPNGLRHEIGDFDRFQPPSDPEHSGTPTPRLVNAHDDIPVLELAGGWYFKHDDPIIGPVLPSLFITIPVWQQGRVIGRDRIWQYPAACIEHTGVVADWGHASDAPFGIACYHDMYSDGDSTDEVDVSDPEGEDAMAWAADYYFDGVRFTQPERRQERIDSFRAAEILFRHAAGRGCAWAWLCLGYLYAYDRAEGKYFRSAFDWSPQSDTAWGRQFYSAPPKPPLPIRAAACFRRAAGEGVAEGCLAYAETLRKHPEFKEDSYVLEEGRSSDEPASDFSARDWLRRAYDIAVVQRNPRIWGSAALRLGEMAAAGTSDEKPDAKAALRWYETAVRGLEQTVRSGLDMFDQLLAEAQNGVEDMKQIF